MRTIKSYSLVLAAALVVYSSLLSLENLQGGKSINQVAEAYNSGTCKWSSSTITWMDDGLSSSHLADVKDAIAHWNDVGANFFLDQVTSSANYKIRTVSRSDVTWLGLNTFTCVNGSFTGSTTELNDYRIGTDRTKAVFTAGHETGHALGFDHTQALDTDGSRALMWASYNQVIAPTLDDIRAVKSKYTPAKTSTSQCTEWKTNGDVIHNGTCSGTAPALPMQEKITTASSTSKAMATTTSSTTTLPSNGALVMTVKVKANTVGKFIMGAFTSNDPGNNLNRIAAIEMGTDGFYLTRSSSTGYTRSTISSTAPTAGQVYFLELVMRDDQTTTAYVFRDNGGPSDPPTYLGSIVTTTIQLPWTSSVYYGTAAYTTASGQPLSDYTISEYYNLLKSYT